MAASAKRKARSWDTPVQCQESTWADDDLLVLSKTGVVNFLLMINMINFLLMINVINDAI